MVEIYLFYDRKGTKNFTETPSYLGNSQKNHNQSPE
jgi:hypothetical protein